MSSDLAVQVVLLWVRVRLLRARSCPS